MVFIINGRVWSTDRAVVKTGLCCDSTFSNVVNSNTKTSDITLSIIWVEYLLCSFSFYGLCNHYLYVLLTLGNLNSICKRLHELTLILV